VASEADWGERFGADLTERELRYLIDHEWAQTAEDVIWRRSKLALRLSGSEVERLQDWMAEAQRTDPAAGRQSRRREMRGTEASDC
jgi:glycerol-3-phosphate dehydrogenase